MPLTPDEQRIKHIASQIKYQNKNPEKVKAWKKKWYDKHSERIKAQRRQRYKKNKAPQTT
jgi:hypothetical protein